LIFQFIQILYWLALSTWFGGVLFVAVAAPIIFRTVRQYNPTLPTVLSVNLEKQHATLLAGSIVANLLGTLVWVQLSCAAALLITVGVQWFYVDRIGYNLMLPAMRSGMLLAAAALVVYDWRFVWPKLSRFRQEYIDHADEPEVANPAKESFDRYHEESVGVLRNVLFLLLGIILFSGDIRPVTHVRATGAVSGPSHATQSR
jgi:hypothetical protein